MGKTEGHNLLGKQVMTSQPSPLDFLLGFLMAFLRLEVSEC